MSLPLCQMQRKSIKDLANIDMGRVAFVVLLCFLLKYNLFTILCEFLLYSKVTQLHMYIFFHILIHYGLSQATEYSSLCSTAGACCLSTLYIITSANPKLPNLPTLFHLATMSLFSMSMNLFLFHGLTDLYDILDCSVTF